MADNEFGYTRWGMDWVRLAEPLDARRPEPLLPRARSIARNGGVRARITGRDVKASIHRGDQASVTHLEVAPLSRARAAAVAAVVGDAVVLTDEQHRALVTAQASPAPVVAATDCSCSARTARCLHVLAVLYDLARRVDENPRVALEIQGYLDAATGEDETAPVESPRWTPINALDPRYYFESPTG